MEAMLNRDSSPKRILPLKIKLTGKRKKNVELMMVNEILEFAYSIKEKQEIESLNHQPLPIKLGFDDNNQSVWVVDSPFIDVWEKLPRLLKLLNFEIVEVDKNLGYLLVEFNQPDDDYWKKNNLNPFELEETEYFIQLGELNGGLTSITWLDEEKKFIDSTKVSEIYLSITDRVRDVLLIKDKQTQDF
jgi:outer membrane protein assembly factor BamC